MPPKATPPQTPPAPPPDSPPDTGLALHNLGQVMRSLEADLRWGLRDSARIPPGWHKIMQGEAAVKKEKTTLRLDSDVIAFFRAMGQGHLVKMNAVLRAFMLARLANVVKSVPDYAPTLADEEGALLAEVMALVKAEEAKKANTVPDSQRRELMNVLLDMRALLRMQKGEEIVSTPATNLRSELRSALTSR